MQQYMSKSMHLEDSNFGKSADEIFDRGFGKAVADGEMYYNPWMGIDKRPKIREALLKQFQKAGPSIDLETGGAGTAGHALIPVYVDPEIVDQTRYETPLRALIPRRAVRGKTYDYNKLTAKGGASWKAEDAPLPEDVDTYDRATVSIKFAYSVGRLSNPAIAAMRGFIDANALDLQVKTQALIELEEDTIINGDASTYTTEFTGLVSSITTNTTTVSDYPTLAGIRDELATCYNAKGRITLAVTDPFTHNYIKGLLMDFQRSVVPPKDNLPFGIPDAFSFDGVNFIKSQFITSTAGSRRILFLDPRYIFMAVLQDITFEELPSVNDSRKYMLKVYEAMVVTFEGCMSQMTSIS